MTKNEYQTDIHELIQKDPHQPKNGRQRKKLAFDKCTLLSSQRSDAPTSNESHDPLPRLGNFSILHIRSRLSSRQGKAQDLTTAGDQQSQKWKKPILNRNPARSPEQIGWGGSLLEGSETFRPSALPFGANNKNITWIPPAGRISPASRACRHGSPPETRGTPPGPAR